MSASVAKQPRALDRPFGRLQLMAHQRPILLAPFRAAMRRHEGALAADLDRWAEAVLGLANVNAGAVALMTLFDVTALTAPGPDALSPLAAAALAAAEICRRAGSAAVRASLQAYQDLAFRPAPVTDAAVTAWWRGLARAAREAPDCVSTLARNSGALLDRCGAAAFEDFVGAGLRAGTDTLKRRAFFALQSPEARRVLDRLSGQATFDRLQAPLRAYATALWGTAFPLQELSGGSDNAQPRRAAVSSGVIMVPDMLPDLPRAAGTDLYRATVAHASAHLALGGAPFAPGSLKPIQIVLVGLIEDARIEALAMRRFPGLRAAWSPFHTVEPSHVRTVPVILARLARGLFDPNHADDDGIVEKGRRLFAREPDLADPGLSRRIGGLLGNDIGQMRIQFDAKQFVIEPAYRDDNLGLWSHPPPPPGAAPPEEIELDVEAVRIDRRPDDTGDNLERREPEAGKSAGRARPVAPDERGRAVARYPEWDPAAGLERPDWVTVREVEARPGSATSVADRLGSQSGLQRRVQRLVRNARIGHPTRLRRQPDGVDLDLDAAIAAAISLRTGELPEDRIHTRTVSRARDLAVLLLLDTSYSTGDPVPAAGAPVIAVAKLAVGLLAEAMGSLGDRFALRGFCSNGRDEVRVTRIKDFDHAFSADAKARLAGLAPGYSTRLGAALRHAGAELSAVVAARRLVIVLTDGAPADIDVAEPADLVADARRAVLGLRGRAIDVFGITLDPSGQGAAPAVFGRSNHLPVRRIEELPRRLSELYFRIARR